MGKLATPDWIREGFDSKADWEKAHGAKKEKKSEKTFRLRRCPNCGSDNVGVVLGEEEGRNKGEWECKKCHWKGTDIKEENLTEEQFMKYLDENGAEVI
jgi:ribosomal protein S27AE